MTYATPRLGTVTAVAVCDRCDEEIVLDAHGWRHPSTGMIACVPSDRGSP